MTNIIPYINFLHKSNEAVTFYRTIFGGDAEVQMDGDHVVQMEFRAGDIHFMGSDTEGNQPNLVLNCDSDDQLKDYYTKLVDGGKDVFTPVDSGWGAIVAHCVDQFGVTWMLNYDKPRSL